MASAAPVPIAGSTVRWMDRRTTIRCSATGITIPFSTAVISAVR